MRELSAIDDDKMKFELSRKIFFDGENTGITIPAHGIQEIVEDNGEGADAYIIKEVMQEINRQFNLTPAEMDHNTKNFRRLIGV